MGEKTEGGPLSRYRAALGEGRILIQQCAQCHQYSFPPRVICPHCGAASLEFRNCSERGTVYSATIVNRSAEKGGPYNVVLIDLDEGVRLMSTIVGLPGEEEVSLGLRVRANIEPGPKPRLVFVPVEEGGR